MAATVHNMQQWSHLEAVFSRGSLRDAAIEKLLGVFYAVRAETT
jgi:hypothetical protein